MLPVDATEVDSLHWRQQKKMREANFIPTIHYLTYFGITFWAGELLHKEIITLKVSGFQWSLQSSKWVVVYAQTWWAGFIPDTDQYTCCLGVGPRCADVWVPGSSEDSQEYTGSDVRHDNLSVVGAWVETSLWKKTSYLLLQCDKFSLAFSSHPTQTRIHILHALWFFF